MKKLSATRLALGLAFGLSLALIGDANAQIRIGVGGPMTGGAAAFGAQLRQGVEQAVADMNAKGGILGQKIELLIGDDVNGMDLTTRRGDFARPAPHVVGIAKKIAHDRDANARS